MRTATRLMVLCLGAVVLAVVGCSRESVEIRNVVEAYNKMLPEALSRPDARVMEYFTTHYELGRIDAYIGYLKTDKRLMVSDLKKLEFLDERVLPNKKEAIVTTRELWRYHYIDEKTRKPITPDEELGYENVYRLVKESGRWVVGKVDIHEKEAAAGVKK